MSRKLFRIFAVITAVALLVGAALPVAAQDQPADKGTIVFIPKSTSATFYLFLVKGAQDKAKELGYTIDYQGPATEADIAAQVDLVRNVIKRKPAGILLAALDSKALIPPVEEAMAAGIPVVMVDSGIDSDVPVASIITDQYAGGWMAGEEMARLLGEKGLVADHGIQAGSVSAGRSKGFQEAIAQYPNMKALETKWTDADSTKSMNITTDELTAHPDLAGIFNACAASTGDAEAVKAKGLAGKVKIVAFDPSPEVLPLFEEGTIQAIIAQDPYQMGYQGVAAIDDFINGRPIANPKVELKPVLITPENVNTPEVQALLQTPDKFEEKPAAPVADRGTIVFIPKSTSATFYLFLVKGAQDKAKELGYTIDYQGPATEADIAAQVDLVRNVIKRKPAGILLAALDSKALIPPVEEAMAAGIPVVMVDSGIDSDVPVASIITDQYAGGWMAGEEMARLLGEKGLVADHGIQAGSVSAGRSKGFQEAIAQYPNMKALETKWTDADSTKSMNITTDELTAHPDLAGIFNACAASTGDAEAVKAKGLAGKVKIVAFDPSPEVLPLFEEGTIQAIIAQDPYQMGYQGVAAIDDFINGRPIANPKVELKPVLITPENVNTPEVQALLQTPDKFEQ